IIRPPDCKSFYSLNWPSYEATSMNCNAKRASIARSSRVGNFARTFLAVVLLGSAGCGSVGGESYYPVKGKIVLADGKPLTSGRVMFVSPQRGLTYGGTVGADGTFSLKAGAREGAPAGSYQVRIEMDETTLPRADQTRTRQSVRLPFNQKYA